jgi:hypothetical protein
MKVKLTESKLKQIVEESVKMVLNEMYENINNSEDESLCEIFNSFRRSQNPMAPVFGLKVGNGGFKYDSKKNEFYYIDANSKPHYTGIKYGEGRIGRNYNLFGTQVAGGGVSGQDVKTIQNQLMVWARKNVPHIDDMVNSSNKEHEQNRAYAQFERNRDYWQGHNNAENKYTQYKQRTDPGYSTRNLN